MPEDEPRVIEEETVADDSDSVLLGKEKRWPIIYGEEDIEYSDREGQKR